MNALDYTELRKEYSEKAKIENKRYGKKPMTEQNPQYSTDEKSRKEFWNYLMTSYMEEIEA